MDLYLHLQKQDRRIDDPGLRRCSDRHAVLAGTWRVWQPIPKTDLLLYVEYLRRVGTPARFIHVSRMSPKGVLTRRIGHAPHGGLA